MKPKAVIDTNIFVSGLINETGGPAKIMSYWEADKFILLVSEPILNEYNSVFSHLTEITPPKIIRLINLISAKAITCMPVETVRVCRDLSDNKFIECAIAGGGEYIVTKNRRHFPKLHCGVKVLTVRQFLDTLEKETG